MKPTYQSPRSSENITSLGVAVGQLITTFLLLEMEAYIEGQRAGKKKKAPNTLTDPANMELKSCSGMGDAGLGKAGVACESLVWTWAEFQQLVPFHKLCRGVLRC